MGRSCQYVSSFIFAIYSNLKYLSNILFLSSVLLVTNILPLLIMDFSFIENGKMLPGDILLTTAFISYVGCFTKQYRIDLVNKMWIPFFKTLDVSLSNVPCIQCICIIFLASNTYHRNSRPTFTSYG